MIYVAKVISYRVMPHQIFEEASRRKVRTQNLVTGQLEHKIVYQVKRRTVSRIRDATYMAETY